MVNLPVTDVSVSAATVAATCWPRPMALRRDCVVAHRLAPAQPSRNTVITPAISHVEPAAIPIAGGPITATSTHTTTASRLAVRARRTPGAWSASW